MSSTRKVFRFAVVGVSTALLYFGLLYVFVEVLAMHPVLASCAVYLVVIGFNYLMHYSWTFTSTATHTKAGKRYVFMTACGFLINFLVMEAGVSLLEINYMLVQAVAASLVILWNFSVSMLWVFRE